MNDDITLRAQVAPLDDTVDVPSYFYRQLRTKFIESNIPVTGMHTAINQTVNQPAIFEITIQTGNIDNADEAIQNFLRDQACDYQRDLYNGGPSTINYTFQRP